jgi:hypothetical protein
MPDDQQVAENTCPNEYKGIVKRLYDDMTDLHEELYKAEHKLHSLGYTKNYLKEGEWEELA